MLTRVIQEQVAMKNFTHTFREDLLLENGSRLRDVVVQYATLGTFVPGKSKVVWVCHALTANSDAANWWPGLIGDSFLYNPEEHFIVCANIIGSCYGSSGPLTQGPNGKPYYIDFPQVTIRDMVAVHELLRKHLGIEHIHTCIGGSLGGQQALEWSIQQPQLIEHLIVMATNAFHSPWGIAFNEAQRMAIKADPTWKDHHEDAGKRGMSAARSMALLSYRSYDTYKKTQSEEGCEKLDSFKAISYQQYQGEKLVRRFNAHTYLLLTHAMDSHNVGRNRGSVEQALALVQSKTLVIGISSDVLFPVCEQQFLAEKINGATYSEIDSLYGHDGFLIEVKKIEDEIRKFYSKK